MSTDSATWLRLRDGELSGIDAFTQRRLTVTGNLDYAIAFEGLFRLVGGRPPLLHIHDVPVGRHRISTMTMGSGPDVLLLHGLGGTRASLLETAAALSTRYRVHAPDLPGFGSSCKPAVGRYNAPWFADDHARAARRARDRPRARGRQLDGRADRDRDGAHAPRPRRRARAAVPGRGLDPPRLSSHRPPPAPRARDAAPQPAPPAWWPGSSGACSQPRPHRSGGRRPHGRRVPAHLPQRRRALRVPGQRPQHLSRGPARPPRVLPPPGRAGELLPCSSGAATTCSSRPPSAATCASGCPAPSRSSCPTAATCPRSSARRRPTSC